MDDLVYNVSRRPPSEEGKMIQVYKIFTRMPDGRLRSLIKHPYSLYYPEGEVIKPSLAGSSLYGFLNEQDATGNWFSSFPNSEVWLCETTGPLRVHKSLRFPSSRSLQQMTDFWRDGFHRLALVDSHIVFPDVCLLERVK